MVKVELNKFKSLLVIGILFFVLVSQGNCQAKQRRGITEWRFKRMNDIANNMHKFGEFDFYLSLLPKETPQNNDAKPLVFKLDLVSEEANEHYHYVPAE